MLDQSQVRAIFAPLEAAIRTEEYTMADLIDLISSGIPESSPVAFAMGQHISEYMRTPAGAAATPTDLIVYAYWMALYDPAGAARFGTNYFTDDIKSMRAYTTAAIAERQMEMAQEAAAQSASAMAPSLARN